MATKSTGKQAPKYRGLVITEEHLATLASMSRRLSTATLIRTPAGFGVLLVGNRFLDLLVGSGWNAASIADWCECFAVLLRADPATLSAVVSVEDGLFAVAIGQRRWSVRSLSGPRKRKS